jgi:TetR/AcrR family transcriptional regulator
MVKPNGSEPPPDETPRDHILDAAAEVFAELGFHGARVDEIARRAGVNKAMLYYRVGDKAALYAGVLSRSFRRAQAAVQAGLVGATSPVERMSALVSAMVNTIVEMPEMPRIMLREIAAGGDSMPPDSMAEMGALLNLVRSVLAEGVDAGVFRPVQPVLTHLTLLGGIAFMTTTRPLRERMAEQGVDTAAPSAAGDLAAFLSDLVLGGITALPKEGATP